MRKYQKFRRQDYQFTIPQTFGVANSGVKELRETYTINR